MRGKEDKGSGEKEVGEREGGGGEPPAPLYPMLRVWGTGAGAGVSRG